MAAAVDVGRAGEDVSQPLHRRQSQVHLVHVVLREICDANVRVQPHKTVDGLEVAEKNFDQRRLRGAEGDREANRGQVSAIGNNSKHTSQHHKLHVQPRCERHGRKKEEKKKKKKKKKIERKARRRQ